MALTLPKIVYTPVGGSIPTTLTFERAPRWVAAYNRAATRRENISTAGVKEAIVERVDEFLELTMERVGSGADVDAWGTFMANALQGIEFNYFPDKDQGAYTIYTLEETDWRADYKTPGQYSFRVKFRKAV